MEEGFRAITIYPAKICGVADRIGSLEVGKDADIAIFDGNPMEIFTRTLYTIINGEIVYCNVPREWPEEYFEIQQEKCRDPVPAITI